MFFARGSVIARIVGANVKDHPDLFQEQVQMYVYEELVEGRKLTEIINTEHENVKYLKGHKIPENIVSWSPVNNLRFIPVRQLLDICGTNLLFNIFKYLKSCTQDGLLKDWGSVVADCC